MTCTMQRLDLYRRPSQQEPWLDVWSRTAPKYRRRAVALLTVTLLLFAGLCIFTYWLRTGSWAPWISADYWGLMYRSLNPIGGDQITLVDFLVFPISIEQVPIQIVIMGLLLASLASIPILVGILYRFPFSLICCAMIALLAAMPWFGLTIAAGCFLASGRPLRLRFRYAGAILGLLPVVMYFVMATRRPSASIAPITPYGFKVYLPWVLAVLGSCVICGVALWLAWMINYRPGGIAPVLAVLFAIPVILFFSQVGRDELEYRLIEHRLGPGSGLVFVNRDLTRSEARDAESLWRRSRGAMFATILRGRIEEVTDAAYNQLALDRATIESACDEFLDYFPTSKYVPCVLYIKARALDQRIAAAPLERESRIQHVSDVPCEPSRSSWELLATRFPGSDPAAVALNRLAVFELREGNVQAAQRRLRALIDHYDQTGTTTQPAAPRPSRSLVSGPAPWETLGIDITAEARRARRLLELITCCGDESPVPFNALDPDGPASRQPLTHPLAALMQLDPHHPSYADNLRIVIDAFPWSALRPVLDARLAMQESSPLRQIELLDSVERLFAGQRACAEAMMWRASTLKELGRFTEAARVYRRVGEDYPDSWWATEARQRLAMLAPLTLAG